MLQRPKTKFRRSEENPRFTTTLPVARGKYEKQMLVFFAFGIVINYGVFIIT